MTERLDNRQFGWLSATVAVTLATHLGHLPIWLTLALAVLLPVRAWTRGHDAPAVGVWIRLPLTGLLVVLVLLNFGNLFGREPGTVLGCGLLALKLLEAERIRDARVALGFCAFVLMSALLFAQSLVFTILICAVLVMLLAALVGLQPAPLPSQRPLRAQVRLALVLLGASLPLSIAAFVLVPRLSSPLWGAPGRDTSARSGLDDHMAPGSMTNLLIDDSPAFRVDFDDGPPVPAQRYFRAIVLWDFDGTTWMRGDSRIRAQREDVQGSSATKLIDYTITLEPTHQRWLPALDLPLTVPLDARLGADRVVIANEPVAQPRQYRLQSATGITLAPTLTGAERVRALTLPAGFDPKTRALAARWHEEGRNAEAVVKAALDLFHASFIYTLSPPLLGRDSIDDFLFDTQRGFCEHYASAFVFLMRAAGIPARIVTGYQGGWWNAEARYLLVRQSDAHAWAEIWIEGHGWQRIDPTAAVSPARVELGAAVANGSQTWAQTDWLRSMRNRFDEANRLWTIGIVRFDALRQKSVLTPFGIVKANPSDLLYALSGVLGLVMLFATLWAMRRPRGAVPGDALDRTWARIGKQLADAGIGPRLGEGPLDLLQRIRATSDAIAMRVAPLVESYVDLRYASAVPPPERIAAFAMAARKLRLPLRVNTVT